MYIYNSNNQINKLIFQMQPGEYGSFFSLYVSFPIWRKWERAMALSQ